MKPEAKTPGELLDGLTDDDLRQTMLAALRLLTVMAVAGAALFWWRAGWQSALLLAIGATISAASLWEWMRLMTAMMERMATHPGAPAPRPVGTILVGFALRLGLTLLVLYVSLKYLNGTVLALAAGLALGVFALTVEGVRLMRRWNS
jgi:hypothetical protein